MPVDRNSKALFASSGAHPLGSLSALAAGHPAPRILPHAQVDRNAGESGEGRGGAWAHGRGGVATLLCG